MNQTELARLLGISRATVSLALAGSEKINADTRRKVCALAAKAGYRPDLRARGLVSKRSGLVGVLFPSFAHRFLGELSDCLMVGLREAGYGVILGVEESAARQQAAIEQLLCWGVDGIIATAEAEEELYRVGEAGTPVVAYRRPVRCPLDYVDVDRGAGVRLAMRHLLDAGRRRIAFVGAINAGATVEPRFSEYKKVLYEEGLPLTQARLVARCGEMREGRDGMRELLERKREPLPDAVVFHNDAMALGGMNEALARGVRIPQDLAVVGFDDIEEAQYAFPPLTTVRQPKEAVAAALVEMLLEKIGAQRGGEVQRVRLLAPELVIRQSTEWRTLPRTDRNGVE